MSTPAPAPKPETLACPECADGCPERSVYCRCHSCRFCEGSGELYWWTCSRCLGEFRACEELPGNREEADAKTPYVCARCWAPTRLERVRALLPSVLRDTQRIVALCEGEPKLGAFQLGQVLGMARSIETALVELAAQSGVEVLR